MAVMGDCRFFRGVELEEKDGALRALPMGMWSGAKAVRIAPSKITVRTTPTAAMMQARHEGTKKVATAIAVRQLL